MYDKFFINLYYFVFTICLPLNMDYMTTLKVMEPHSTFFPVSYILYYLF